MKEPWTPNMVPQAVYCVTQRLIYSQNHWEWCQREAARIAALEGRFAEARSLEKPKRCAVFVNPVRDVEEEG